MSEIQVTGVVSATNVLFYVLGADGQTLAAEKDEAAANRKAGVLKSFNPFVEERVSNYLIGGTKFIADGKEIELPSHLKTEKDGKIYNASVRIPAAYISRPISVGDSVDLKIDEDLLESEGGTTPTFKATADNFKLAITPRGKKATFAELMK